MSDLVSVASNTLTNSATWGVVEATSKLVSTNTGSTALSTSNQDSSTFVPANQQLVGIAVRVASRATGSPSNKITVILRNSTGGSDVATCVANVSDLPVSSTGTESEGGWVYFKFAAAHTPNGTDSYLVRCKLDSTSTAVSLATNGTSANWQRMLVRSTTAAPTTGDDMHVCGTLDCASSPSAATVTAITVTMDETSATDYGSASTSVYIAALDISKNGTLTWGTTAATTYILQLSGHLKVYRDGTYNQGTVATAIPRDSTATLQFDCAADSDFGFIAHLGSTIVIQGLSRTSGKNFVWTLLTADASASATSLTVQDDTGWKNGDRIAIASTTRTMTECEDVLLTADAGASSLTVGAITNAHKGTASTVTQAEVCLLTRNCVIKSVSSTNTSFVTFTATANVDIDWCDFQYMKGNSQWNSAIGVYFGTTSGTVTIDYCTFRDMESTGVGMYGSVSTAFYLRHCIFYKHGTVNAFNSCFFINTIIPSAIITIDDIVLMRSVNTFGQGFVMNCSAPQYLAIGAVRSNSHDRFAINIANGGYVYDSVTPGLTWGPFNVHSCSSSTAIQISGSIANLKFAAITSWRSSGVGLSLGGTNQFLANIEFTDAVICFGNSFYNVQFAGGTAIDILFRDLRCYGDTSFSSSGGLIVTGQGFYEVRVEKGDFGTASGNWTTHSSADFGYSSSGTWSLGYNKFILKNCLFASSVGIDVPNLQNNAVNGTIVQAQRYNRSNGDHRAYVYAGSVKSETTTFDVTPSIKMTPLRASYKLDSACGVHGRGYLVHVDNGQTITVSVKVQKDASYNGNAARLIVKANPAVGINSDTVLDTHSAASGSFQTLSGTTAAAIDNGVMEFVVDCDGTAGNIYVDTFAAS